MKNIELAKLGGVHFNTITKIRKIIGIKKMNKKQEIQLLLNLTKVELVLDPFMGSGTTGRVCDKLERSFVGYDLKEFLKKTFLSFIVILLMN